MISAWSKPLNLQYKQTVVYIDNSPVEKQTEETFSTSNSKTPTRSETSDIINLISFLSRFELTQKSNTEDVNTSFPLLSEVLEILGSQNNITDKAVKMLHL